MGFVSELIDETLNSARSHLVLSLHTRRTSDSTRGPVCQLLAITSESGAESEGEKFRDEGDGGRVAKSRSRLVAVTRLTGDTSVTAS